jgi:nitrogen fixation protein FixH
MSAAIKKPFEVRGWHVLAAMLAFFGAVIAVNAAFAVIAVRSFPGEDVRRSYLQGLQYNDTLAERRAQAELGWSAAVELAAGTADSAEVRIRLTDRNGAALDGLAVAGDLQWPTNAQFDQALAFSPIGDGVYVARTGGVHPGRWRLRARAEGADARALDFEAELTWPASR